MTKNRITATKKRILLYLKRRPHRSFRRTRRRDYARKLNLPGYLSFTKYVFSTIWSNRKIFILFAILYSVVTVFMVGMSSQDTFTTLIDTLKITGGEMLSGVWGKIGGASLLFVTAITGGLSGTLDDVQQLYAGLIIVFAWLTSVWLLRNILAGHKVKLRDALYNAGSPIIPTLLIFLLLMVQMLPFALAVIGYSSAVITGLLDGGIEAMLFWVAAGLLTTLSLYWATSTAFALIVVTLPGMYPFRSIKIAGDLVMGCRLQILLRFVWMMAVTAIVWTLVMIPLILFDTWLIEVWPAVSWVPIVPAALLMMAALTVIWLSSYIYLLYRKVVADESNSVN